MQAITQGRIARKEREKLRCRSEILAAASKLFARHGIASTSMKQIADETDMSVGKLYACFRGKEEIVRELLEDSIRSMLHRGDEACSETDPPLVQLRCRLAAVIDHFKCNMDFLTIYHNESPMSCEGIIRKHLDHSIDTAAGLLEQAIRDGDLSPEEPRTLAVVLVGSVHELMHEFGERGDRGALDRIPAVIDRIIMKPIEARRTKESGLEGR